MKVELKEKRMNSLNQLCLRIGEKCCSRRLFGSQPVSHTENDDEIEMMERGKREEERDKNSTLSFMRFCKKIMYESHQTNEVITCIFFSFCIDGSLGYFLSIMSNHPLNINQVFVFTFLRIIKVFYQEYFLQGIKRRQRIKISEVYHKEMYEKKSRIEYEKRETLDEMKYEKLKSKVENGLHYTITWGLSQIVDLFTSFLYSSILLIHSGYMGYTLILLFGFIFIFIFYSYPKIKKHNQMKITEYKKEREVEEAKVKMAKYGFVAFPEKVDRIQHLVDVETQLIEVYEKIYTMPYEITIVFQMIGEFILIFYMYYLVQNTQKQTFMYFVLISISIQLFGNTSGFLNTIQQLDKIISDYTEFLEFFEVLNQEEKSILSPSVPEIFKLEVNICIYDEYYLQGIVEFIQGDSIFVTGEKGNGKSTLMKRIAGVQYLKPGDINYRNRVYYVPQTIELERGVYTWELCFPNKTMNEIIRLLNKYDFPVWKKIKHDTKLTDTIPLHLSGGEKKTLHYAILLTKEIHSDIDILIMDEPHKDLDDCSAVKMIQGIRNLYQKLTIFVVKHEKPREFTHWNELFISNKGEIIRK